MAEWIRNVGLLKRTPARNVGQWCCGPQTYGKENMAQKYPGGGSQLHNSGEVDSTYTIGRGALGASGERHTEPGDPATARAAELAGILSSIEVRQLRNFIRRTSPDLADRLDGFCKRHLGEYHRDPGAVVEANPVADLERHAQEYARNHPGSDWSDCVQYAAAYLDELHGVPPDRVAQAIDTYLKGWPKERPAATRDEVIAYCRGLFGLAD
jgi:hypothetical protein